MLLEALQFHCDVKPGQWHDYRTHAPCTEWLDMIVKERQHADGQAVTFIEPASQCLLSVNSMSTGTGVVSECGYKH